MHLVDRPTFLLETLGLFRHAVSDTLASSSTLAFSIMRRVAVRRSPIHGKGVFALRQITAGDRILEYKGIVTTWKSAIRRHERDGVEGHTFLFGLSDGRVIDGGQEGNSARWVNHACAANCEAIEESGRVYFHATKDLEPGMELLIDYALELDVPVTDEIARGYICRCGSPICRGTMLGI